MMVQLVKKIIVTVFSLFNPQHLTSVGKKKELRTLCQQIEGPTEEKVMSIGQEEKDFLQWKGEQVNSC